MKKTFSIMIAIVVIVIGAGLIYAISINNHMPAGTQLTPTTAPTPKKYNVTLNEGIGISEPKP